MSPKAAAIISYPATHATTGAALDFNMEYYLSTHMPLIERVWGPHGLRSWSINTFAPTCPVTEKQAPYLVQTTCIFDSVEGFKQALEKGSEESGKDVQNFSNVWPDIGVAEMGEGKTL